MKETIAIAMIVTLEFVSAVWIIFLMYLNVDRGYHFFPFVL